MCSKKSLFWPVALFALLQWSPAFAYWQRDGGGVCYSPRYMSALFSKPKKQGGDLKGDIRGLERDIRGLQRDMDEMEAMLSGSLDRNLLKDDPNRVAGAVRGYIEGGQSGWGCDTYNDATSAFSPKTEAFTVGFLDGFEWWFRVLYGSDVKNPACENPLALSCQGDFNGNPLNSLCQGDFKQSSGKAKKTETAYREKPKRGGVWAMEDELGSIKASLEERGLPLFAERNLEGLGKALFEQEREVFDFELLGRAFRAGFFFEAFLPSAEADAEADAEAPASAEAKNPPECEDNGEICAKGKGKCDSVKISEGCCKGDRPKAQNGECVANCTDPWKTGNNDRKCDACIDGHTLTDGKCVEDQKKCTDEGGVCKGGDEDCLLDNDNCCKKRNGVDPVLIDNICCREGWVKQDETCQQTCNEGFKNGNNNICIEKTDQEKCTDKGGTWKDSATGNKCCPEGSEWKGKNPTCQKKLEGAEACKEQGFDFNTDNNTCCGENQRFVGGSCQNCPEHTSLRFEEPSSSTYSSSNAPSFQTICWCENSVTKDDGTKCCPVGKTRLNANGECVTQCGEGGGWNDSGECKCEAPNKQEDNACYTPKEYCNNVKDGECKPNTNSDACVENDAYKDALCCYPIIGEGSKSWQDNGCKETPTIAVDTNTCAGTCKTSGTSCSGTDCCEKGNRWLGTGANKKCCESGKVLNNSDCADSCGNNKIAGDDGVCRDKTAQEKCAEGGNTWNSAGDGQCCESGQIPAGENCRDAKDCPQWKGHEAFKPNGKVTAAFCDTYAGDKRACKRALRKMQRLAGQIAKAVKDLEDKEDERWEQRHGDKEEKKTEAGGLCWSCLKSALNASRPSAGQQLGNALSVLGGAGLSLIGYNMGRRAQYDANQLRIKRGGYAAQNDLYSFAGARAGFPFVHRGIYGMTKVGTPSGGWSCSPSLNSPSYY